MGKKWIYKINICMCCAVAGERNCGRKELYYFFIVDIKVTKMNLEQNFVLVNIL
jgi:hypothetical protein